MSRSLHFLRSSLVSTLFAALAACTGADIVDPDDAGAADGFIGRWAGATQPVDFSFAMGRGVRLDEVFELRADGTMLGDFAGWDDVSGCVITYRLEGSYAVTGDAIDVGWDSIRAAIAGCSDSALDQPASEVDAGERALWNSELDGIWTVNGDVLTIGGPGGAIRYSRVSSPLVARWEGTSLVDDFEFAGGREVTLRETFWMNQDGSLAGFFTGADAVSGCNVDYRMRGSWVVDATVLDARWTSIRVEIWGCIDAASDLPPTDVLDLEGDLWDDELDGRWSVVNDRLAIEHASGTVEYRRAL